MDISIDVLPVKTYKRGDIFGMESFFNYDYHIFEAICIEAGFLYQIPVKLFFEECCKLDPKMVEKMSNKCSQ